MSDLTLSLIQKTLRRSDGRNIIAVVSGKRDVGKNWICVLLAGLLANNGQKVLLFDGDLGLANIDVQLGLMSVPAIELVLTGKMPMNQIIRHFDRGGFDIITGRINGSSFGSVDDGMKHVLKDDLLLLATHYDSVIVDLNVGISGMSDLFIHSVGTILVVCTDDKTALTDAYTLMHQISEAGESDKIQVVVNQASSVKEGERTYYTLIKACSDFLSGEPPLAGIIRDDISVADALRHQIPILNAYPDSDVVTDVKKIVKNLIKYDKSH